MNKIEVGKNAEQLACDYLQERGLTLLQRNYRCRRGELDLIMREGDTTVFVEVRLRRPSAYVSAAASVDRRKQEKLIVAAQYYLLQHPAAARRPCRFDIIAITPDQGQYQIDWLVHAFEIQHD